MGDSQALNMYVRQAEGCYWKKLAEIFRCCPKNLIVIALVGSRLVWLPRVCMEDTSLSAIIPKLFAEG